MNEQLQIQRKLNLDRHETSSKFDRIETVNFEDRRSQRDDLPSANSHTPIEVPEWDANLDIIFATVELTDLHLGKSFLDIKHETAPEDRHKPYYSTSITNRSAEALRIDRFGSYTPKGDILVLHSITGGFFSGQQFQEWYSLPRTQWIEPGEVVTDPNNHSNLGVYWVYFGTTASGEKFVAGAPWLGAKPWWQLW